MTLQPRENPLLPFRLLILMPWRWRWWTWAILFLSLPIGYFLSAVPAYQLVLRGRIPQGQLDALAIFYRPVQICEEQSRWVRHFEAWEHQVMFAILGPDKHYGTGQSDKGKYGNVRFGTPGNRLIICWLHPDE